MTKVTRKPRQSRRVAMRFASKMNGKKKTLCQRRYRGSVKVRWLQLSSPCSPLTLLSKTSTLPLPGTKVLINPQPFSWDLPSNSVFISFLKTNTLVLSFQARNMTMRVRRPLQGTLRKKIQSYDTQSKKVKKIRKPNCFFCSYECKKLNQSRKRYQNMRQSQSRRQKQSRR